MGIYEQRNEVSQIRLSYRSEFEQLLREEPWLNNYNRVKHPARAIGLSHCNP